MKDGRIVGEGTPKEAITAETIEEVYGVKASVDRHPGTGLLNVVYHPRHSLAGRSRRRWLRFWADARRGLTSTTAPDAAECPV